MRFINEKSCFIIFLSCVIILTGVHNMQIIYIILLVLLSYTLGSIPTGLILGKVFKGIDIREHGSGNTGATNTVRVLGFKIGIWAFVFDFLKGGFVMFLLWIFKWEQFYILGVFNTEILYGFVAVIGHVYPVYIGFKGGKAMATSAGVILFIEPLIALAAIVTFVSIFLKNRIVSIASLSAAGITLLLMIIRPVLYSLFPEFFSGLTDKGLETYALESLIIVLIAVLIFYRHISNLKKLGQGKEYIFKKKK
jgi:acyl phosphate:glycerol-3-phosphate acyltransferase